MRLNRSEFAGLDERSVAAGEKRKLAHSPDH